MNCISASKEQSTNVIIVSVGLPNLSKTTEIQTENIIVSVEIFLAISFQDTSFEDGSDSFSIQSEPTLSEFVQDFLSHLNDSPGAFETDIEHITAMLNGWVTTDEMLHELVELIYQQVCFY